MENTKTQPAEDLNRELEVLKKSEETHLDEIKYHHEKSEKFLYQLRAIQERITHVAAVLENK
jgi:hypothetical protein